MMTLHTKRGENHYGMQNHKASGPNDLPIDTLKVIVLYTNGYDLYNEAKFEPIRFVFEILTSIWQGSPIQDEWAKVT